MEQTSKHIIFVGRVQGVGFRFTAFDIANRYNLTGIVRNLLDGTVEMITQGHSENINDCITDIREMFGNHIREAKIEEIPLNPKYKDFKITF